MNFLIVLALCMVFVQADTLDRDLGDRHDLDDDYPDYNDDPEEPIYGLTAPPKRNTQPSNGHKVHGHPVNDQPIDGQPDYEDNGNEYGLTAPPKRNTLPSNGHKVHGHPVNDQPIDGQPAYEDNGNVPRRRTKEKKETERKKPTGQIELTDQKELNEIDKYFRIRLENIYNDKSKDSKDQNYAYIPKIYGGRRMPESQEDKDSGKH